MKYTLTTDSAQRKDIPMYSGCLMYFPAALAGVAMHSKAGNDKHNPGQPLHHSRGKSNDHVECIIRHLVDMGDLQAVIDRNKDEPRYTADEVKALLTEANANAWRALALSQELHERYAGAPLAPRAVAETVVSLSGVDNRVKCLTIGCESDREPNSSFCKSHRPPAI